MKTVFIGAGKMATALATAIVKGGLVDAADITAADILPQARKAFTENTGVNCVEDVSSLIPTAELLVLAVKPQVAEAAVKALPKVSPKTLVISICAGVTLTRLASWFGHGRIVRVMPNTPLMVGKGASCFAAGPQVTEADAAFAKQLLGAAGIAFQVAEEQLDAVTGLSGSGPAYVFELAKAMALAGENVGLAPEMSLELTIQTIAGAAEMLSRKLGTPDSLRDAVTSPNGTTAAGLAVMREADFRKIISDTVLAATKRSTELGK